MNLTSPSQVRSLLDKLGMRPSKALDQNFLIDKNILDIFLETAHLSSDDEVLEVGPGLGVVTEQLLERVRRVVVVEKDRRLFNFLQERFRGENGLELVCADALEIGIKNLLDPAMNKVVSNLPYSVGTRILVDLVRCEERLPQIVVTVQLEVARRLAAQPDNRDYGMLSVWLQSAYHVEVVKTVSPTCFWPRPEVKSAIVNLTKHSGFLLTPEEEQVFYRLTKYAFMHRRKQLATILSGAPGRLNTALAGGRKLLKGLGLDEKSRPENLSVADWCVLSRKLLRES